MNAEVINEFVQATSTRLPNVHEMLSLCDSLGIVFAIENGVTGIKAKADVREEAKVLAGLFRREPFRTEVLKARMPQEPVIEAVAETVVEQVDEEIEKPGPVVPHGATIVVADEKGYTDKEMRGPAYTWCWIDGPTWYYVKDYPIPKSGK